MKKTLFLLILMLLAVLCAGCGGKPPASGTYDLDAVPLPCSQETLYAQLFDLNNKIEISLDMEESEIAKLQSDYDAYSSRGSKSPIYRMADLSITVTTEDGTVCTYILHQVGVRMKGNTSRTSFYSKEDGIYNQIHLKLSFQETFDEEAYYGADALTWQAGDRAARKERTFATLEKLDLRWNKCADSTYLRELYAYEIYRDQGVLAPHMNLSTLNWSGLHMGIYSINEPVDKIFLEKHLPKEALGGDLYKCGWSYTGASFTSMDSIGIEDEDAGEFYAFDLKTNKKTSSHQSLIRLITELNSEAVTKNSLAQLIDMDNFLSYSAVSWLLGNPDDLRNNYNNFYLYFRGDNGKALFIPYDFDRCFGINMFWNPTGTSCTDDDPFSTERMGVDRRDTGADRSQRNPLILYTVARGGYYTGDYARKLEALAQTKWVSIETFSAYFRTAESLYASDAIPHRTFYNNPDQDYRFDFDKTADFSSTENISFREYVAAKLATLEKGLENGDYTADPIIYASYYIRADYTNWDCHPDHTMTPEDGVFVYQLRADSQVRLKVYAINTDRWYGSECLSTDSPACETDGHTNLVLGPGSYTIRFDPVSCQITVEKGLN